MCSSTSSCNNRSFLSWHRMMFILGYFCLWTLPLASGFNSGLSSSSRMITQVSPPMASRSHSTSSLVLKAVPPKRKFKRLRKSLFSRTRRRYQNGGDIAPVEEDKLYTPTSSPSSVDEEELFEMIRNKKLVNDIKRQQIGKRMQAIRYDNSKDAGGIKRQRVGKRMQNIRKVAALKKKIKKKKEPIVIETVEELRHAILDQQLSLSDTKIVERKTHSATAAKSLKDEQAAFYPKMDHAVRSLIKERYLSKSTPGNRLANDNSTLAIAIEGGGMRGCVSAGMVAAITALGLSDSIDTIYGSSAGSVVGAYMVSRQVCLDVYVDILPASKKLFVCKKRMVTNLASLGLERVLSNGGKSGISSKRNKESGSRPGLSSLKERLSNTQPGMNISFVLDGIMGNENGLRPLDIDFFKENNKKQKLRVVSSCVDPKSGKLFSKCFGDDEFFHEDHAMVRADKKREGLFACLQASMTVPGATGPPVDLVRRNYFPQSNATSSLAEPSMPCFDAFCFEPIPYRSAVKEGATHVLVLATRPEDFIPTTKPSIYETGIAPLYFNSHNQSKVSKFFAKGGQQYLYAEDLMLLEDAKRPTQEGVLVPPPEILYGVERTNDISSIVRNREENWKKAHLFPLRVPKGYKELATLEQDKDEVLEAVRDGFMTAFDALSDIVGLEGYNGRDVAELVFPSSPDEDKEKAFSSSAPSSSVTLTPREKNILRTPLRVPGEPIPNYRAVIDDDSLDETPKRRRRQLRILRRIRRGGGRLFRRRSHEVVDTKAEEKVHRQEKIILDEEEFSASTLLECLPGFQEGQYSHLAKALIEQHSLLQP